MNGYAISTYALTLHGILYAGQTPSTSVLNLCQTALNNLLAEWNAQGLAVYSVVKTGPFALTSGTADYPIGAGVTGTGIVTPRPEKIEAWNVYDTSGASNGGKPVDPGTFAREADDNTLTSSFIKLLNYDASFTATGGSPAGVVHLFPTPNATLQLVLWVWEQLTAIATPFLVGDADISYPPGYLKAIAYNLAVDVAPLMGRQVDPNVLRIANDCKATLGGTNISELTRQDPKTVPQR